MGVGRGAVARSLIVQTLADLVCSQIFPTAAFSRPIILVLDLGEAETSGMAMHGVVGTWGGDSRQMKEMNDTFCSSQGKGHR